MFAQSILLFHRSVVESSMISHARQYKKFVDKVKGEIMKKRRHGKRSFD